MPGQGLLYLSRADVEAIGVTMPEIIEALEVAFGEHGQGRVEMPPEPGVHYTDSRSAKNSGCLLCPVSTIVDTDRYPPGAGAR